MSLGGEVYSNPGKNPNPGLNPNPGRIRRLPGWLCWVPTAPSRPGRSPAATRWAPGVLVRPVESLAVVASADDWMVVGVVTRPGTTPPSRGDSRPREPEPAPVPDTIVVTGSGHGHGVGMSQWGVHGMALQGKSYIEILTHYYTGTKVETR